MSPEHLRCEVVTLPAIFNSYNRPFVIVSRNPTPEYPDQHVALGISRLAGEHSVPIDASDWVVGSLSEQSHIRPRFPTIIGDSDVGTTVGALAADVVDEAVAVLAEQVGATDL